MSPTVPDPVDDSQAVVDLVQHVYDTLIVHFDAAGVALPARREVVIGELAVDSEVFGVMFGGCHIGPPGNELSQPLRGDTVRTVELSIQLWRQIATGGGGARTRAPRAGVITAQAKVAMVDAWLLLQGALRCDFVGGPGVIASVAPLPPQGGMQGIELSLSLQVP